MQAIKNWLIQKFLGSYIKSALDWVSKKLGVDGLKTLIGILLLVLSQLALAHPEAAPIISYVIEFLRPYADGLTDAGMGLTIVGLLHKVLKKAFPDEKAS